MDAFKKSTESETRFFFFKKVNSGERGRPQKFLQKIIYENLSGTNVETV